MEKNKIIFLFGLLVFISYLIYSYLSVKDYMNDSLILIAILILLFLLRNKLKLTPVSFSLIILGAASHLSGVFGWYSHSPFPMQYDHITHFLGFFAVSYAAFPIFRKRFDDKYLSLLFLLFFSLGIGAVIEQAEYLGYITLGTGEGFLKFGGLGDTTNDNNLSDIDIIGGGWINTMLDLNYNLLGSVIGIITAYIASNLKNKKHT